LVAEEGFEPPTQGL